MTALLFYVLTWFVVKNIFFYKHVNLDVGNLSIMWYRNMILTCVFFYY
jgi:hypothetical protein